MVSILGTCTCYVSPEYGLSDYAFLLFLFLLNFDSLPPFGLHTDSIKPLQIILPLEIMAIVEEWAAIAVTIIIIRGIRGEAKRGSKRAVIVVIIDLRGFQTRQIATRLFVFQQLQFCEFLWIFPDPVTFTDTSTEYNQQQDQ